jgi:predicted CXXCH cytochrome family protein
LGGLSKKAFQLEKIEKLHELPHLLLDAGNLLFKQDRLSPGLLIQSEITAAGIIDAYNYMGYDAVAVGRNDLAAGMAFLQEKAAASKFTWLSANLVSKSEAKPLFPPSLIRKIGSLSVGIIGLTDFDASPRFPGNEDVVLLPWQKVLPQLIEDLAPRCDLIILLSNYEPKQNEAIAESFSNIHIIFQSMPHSRNSVSELKNNTLLAMTDKQGKYLGSMLIDWQKSQTWGRTGAAKELAQKKQELDGINGRVSRMEKRRDEQDLAIDPNYQKLIATKKRLLSEIIFLENELSGLKESGQAPSTFENHFIALDIGLPDQPDVEKIVKATKQKVNEAGRNQFTGVKQTSSKTELQLEKLVFAGWQTCAACHKPQTDFWLKTEHASAYQTLVEQDQQFNLACLPCHVTSEYKDIKISEDDTVLLSLPAPLQLVGCEICHGPGKSHAASQLSSAISRKPYESICIRCHTAERDENFNYDNDFEKIACPASQH